MFNRVYNEIQLNTCQVLFRIDPALYLTSGQQYKKRVLIWNISIKISNQYQNPSPCIASSLQPQFKSRQDLSKRILFAQT